MSLYSIPPVSAEPGQFDELIETLLYEIGLAGEADAAILAERAGFPDGVLAIEQLERAMHLVGMVRLELVRASGIGRN